MATAGGRRAGSRSPTARGRRRLVEVDRFLARAPSRGHAERPAPDSEYTSFDAADLDVKVVLALAREDRTSPRSCTCPRRASAATAAARGCILAAPLPAVRRRRRAAHRQHPGRPRAHARGDRAAAAARAARAAARPRALPRAFAVLNLGVYRGALATLATPTRSSSTRAPRASSASSPRRPPRSARRGRAAVRRHSRGGLRGRPPPARPARRDRRILGHVRHLRPALHPLPAAQPRRGARGGRAPPRDDARRAPARARPPAPRFAADLLRRYPAGALVRGAAA